MNAAVTFVPMTIAASLILAAATAAAPLPQGAQVVSAQVAVEILKPVAVRQASGPVGQADMPTYQLTRREGAVLVEFE